MAMSLPQPTPSFFSALILDRALGAGTESNIASTITYSDLFPTGFASTSVLTNSDGAATATSTSTDASSSGSGSGGGRSSQTLYLIIFLSILCILLIASILIAIRAVALRRRYRTEIQRALARGELPPFHSAYVDPSNGRASLPPSYGLPRWTAFLFGFSGEAYAARDGQGGEYDSSGTGMSRGDRSRRLNADNLYGFGLGGIAAADHFRGFRTGGMATERERQRREKKYVELPLMWEYDMIDGRILGEGEGPEKGKHGWMEDVNGSLDLADMKPLSVATLVHPAQLDPTRATQPIQTSAFPPNSRPRAESSSSLAPPLFSLAPLTETISRTLTRYTTNGSDVTVDGPMTVNEVLTGRMRSHSAASGSGSERGGRERGATGINRDGVTWPEVVHEVANEDASRGPSRNVSRRPSLMFDGQGTVAVGPDDVNVPGDFGNPGVDHAFGRTRRYSVRIDANGIPMENFWETSRAGRAGSSSAVRTRNGRGGYGNVMSSRNAPGPPPRPSQSTNDRNRSASRQRMHGELPTAIPLTRDPADGERVRVGFLIRMPERECDPGVQVARHAHGISGAWDDDESQAEHAMMELGILDGTIDNQGLTERDLSRLRTDRAGSKEV